MASNSEVKTYLKYAELANAAYAFEAIYTTIDPDTEELYTLEKFLYNGRAFSSNQAQQFVIQYQSSIAQTSYEYFQEKGDNSESSGFKAALLKENRGQVMNFHF